MPVTVNQVPAFSSFETIEAVMDADQYGFATAKVSYYASSESEMISMLRSGGSCPLVSAGMMKTARFLHGSANTEEGGVWKVTLFWKGVAKLRLEESAIPKYTPIALTAPIETHPLFQEFAGVPGATENDAQFDDQGNFTRFAPFVDGSPEGEINPKAGISSYFQATLKVGEKRGIKHEDVASSAEWDRVGKISQPKIKNMIDIQLPVPGMDDATRDYLLMSVNLEDMGNGYALMDREWDMSGPYGWDKDIYDYED